MSTTDPDPSIVVSLADDSHSIGNVRLNISGALSQVICVSPEQARRLALELVQAVQRLDIRLRLQEPQEMVVHPAGLEQCTPARPN